MANDIEFAKYIDNLREDRGINREDFVDGVVSLRHYYRFAKGQSSLRTDTLSQLLDKLELNSLDAYRGFLSYENKTKERLSEAYFQINRRELGNTMRIMKTLNRDSIVNNGNRKLYDLIQIDLFHLQKKYSNKQAIEKYQALVDYPNILTKKFLSFVEMNALLALATLLVSSNDDFKIANHLYNILMEDKFDADSHDINIKITYYSNCTKFLGLKGDTEKALILANEGIRLCRKHSVLTSLSSFYYFKALSEKELGKFDDSRKSTTILYSILNFEGNDSRTAIMKGLIEKHIGYKESDLIEYK